MQPGAIDQHDNRNPPQPGRADHSLLSTLLWLKLVTYRPYLLPAMDQRDVTNHVETLAGHVADLLTKPEHQSAPSNVVDLAHAVLDICCEFVQRWTGQPAPDEEFAVDVERLRTRLRDLCHQLSPNNAAVRSEAS